MYVLITHSHSATSFARLQDANCKKEHSDSHTYGVYVVI